MNHFQNTKQYYSNYINKKGNNRLKIDEKCTDSDKNYTYVTYYEPVTYYERVPITSKSITNDSHLMYSNFRSTNAPPRTINIPEAYYQNNFINYNDFNSMMIDPYQYYDNVFPGRNKYPRSLSPSVISRNISFVKQRCLSPSISIRFI